MPKCGIGKNGTVGFLVPNELKGGGTEMLTIISVLSLFRDGFFDHPKQVLIELYSKVDGGEPSYLTIGEYR